MISTHFSDTYAMTEDIPRWAEPSGLPTRHVLSAAVHVIQVLGPVGARVADTHESYWDRATGGIFPPADLQLAQQLLLDCELLEQQGDRLLVTERLRCLPTGDMDEGAAALAAYVAARLSVASTPDLRRYLHDLVPDQARREAILIAAARRHDDEWQSTVGDIGEELALAAARSELVALGRSDLANQARRVSLESDQLGYDIVAPRLDGPNRLLEVKATTHAEQIRVHLSRNEATTGQHYPDWSLVICHVTDVASRAGTVVGWCAFSLIATLLPTDGTGSRWESAEVTLPPDCLYPGLPRASH